MNMHREIILNNKKGVMACQAKISNLKIKDPSKNP